MKKNTYPPLIILFDMLFVLLFILILNNDTVISIEVPQDSLFKGGKILYFNGSMYVDVNTGLGSSYSSPLIKCGEQKECIDARLKYKDSSLYILLTEKSVKEISEISLISLEAGFCKKLKFYISYNGDISYKRLVTDNNCLLKINGFQKKYMKKLD